jgi:hypothetical protein
VWVAGVKVDTIAGFLVECPVVEAIFVVFMDDEESGCLVEDAVLNVDDL